MNRNNKAIIVYNMGNFKTHAIKQTSSKEAKETLEQAGWKLISSIMVDAVTWLSRGNK